MKILRTIHAESQVNWKSYFIPVTHISDTVKWKNFRWTVELRLLSLTISENVSDARTHIDQNNSKHILKIKVQFKNK